MAMDLNVAVENLGFPEGPVAMIDGSLLFVDIKDQLLLRLCPDGKLDRVAALPGGPNGLAIGPDGAAYVCNNGGVYSFDTDEQGVTVPGARPDSYRGGSIQRVDLATGQVTTLYDSHNAARLLAPDDIVFDSAGGFWFTDSGLHNLDGSTFGALYYATIDGTSLTRAATIAMPNGVGLSRDGKVLYVSDTIFGRLWALDVIGPGKVAQGPLPVMVGRVVQTLPGFQWLDSLKVEEGGRVCVGTIFNGGISIFSPDGSVEHVAVPDIKKPDIFTTNLCFGGADMRDVWITASSTGKIYKGRWPRPGLKLAFNA